MLKRLEVIFQFLKDWLTINLFVIFGEGASSQQPSCVIDSVCNLHKNQYSNIHRGVRFLSMESTSLYESARGKVRDFINVVFKRSYFYSWCNRTYQFQLLNLKLDQIYKKVMKF